jgi:hypothetical protein
MRTGGGDRDWDWRTEGGDIDWAYEDRRWR